MAKTCYAAASSSVGLRKKILKQSWLLTFWKKIKIHKKKGFKKKGIFFNQTKQCTNFLCQAKQNTQIQQLQRKRWRGDKTYPNKICFIVTAVYECCFTWKKKKASSKNSHVIFCLVPPFVCLDQLVWATVFLSRELIASAGRWASPMRVVVTFYLSCTTVTSRLVVRMFLQVTWLAQQLQPHPNLGKSSVTSYILTLKKKGPSTLHNFCSANSDNFLEEFFFFFCM